MLSHDLTPSVTIVYKHTYIISVNLDDHGGYPNILLTGPQTIAKWGSGISLNTKIKIKECNLSF